MTRNSDRRGDWDPITYAMLAKAATINRNGPGARLALECCEAIKAGGGRAKIEENCSLGAYRVRSRPEDEWLVFNKF